MTDVPNDPPAPLPSPAAPPQRIDLDDPAVVEDLVRYDDLDRAALARFEADPSARVVLDLLRRADAELARGAPEEFEFSAEELYDHGAAGRDAAEFDPARARSIGRYLAARPELMAATSAVADAPLEREASFGESLGWPATVDELPDGDRELARRIMDTAPAHPVLPPLAVGATAAAAEPPAAVGAAADQPAGPASAAATPAPRGPGWLAWAPLAAAALVAAMALGGEPRRGAHDGGLPSSPLLRSGAEAPLLFPRGRVAHSPSPNAWCNRPLFEVAPVTAAAGYRFSLMRLPENASVFDEGTELWRTDSTLPMATGPALEPGRYEWQATALINGLERPLGRKAFSVVTVAAPAVLAAAGADPSIAEDEVRLEVRTLHAAAFLTDARHRARALEPSEERADYLRSPE